MEAGDCPTLNMNAMKNYLLSHSLNDIEKHGFLLLIKEDAINWEIAKWKSLQAGFHFWVDFKRN